MPVHAISILPRSVSHDISVLQRSTSHQITVSVQQAAAIDSAAPVFTSAAVAANINSNSGAGQVIYTAAATDDSLPVTYSLKPVGDHAAFAINGSTGAVTLTANPDYETQASYAFTVVATDAAGNASEQAVALAITDVDELAPVFTSGATAAAIAEKHRPVATRGVD